MPDDECAAGRSAGSVPAGFALPRVDVSAGWVAALLIAVGVGLRWYRLDQQFLLDDEFHALMAAARYPLGHLATHFLFAANSIPFNLYTRATYELVGWDEMTLRLPSVVAGIGLLVSAWRWSRPCRTPTERVMIVGLLAISPLLVYYSRITRPYSMLVWLAFFNLTTAYRLARSAAEAGGGPRALTAIGWGVSGALAVWVHQVAAFAVVANALVLAVAWLRSIRRECGGAATLELAWGAATLALVGGALLGPAGVSSGAGFTAAYASRDVFGPRTLWDALHLALGSGWPGPTLAAAAVLAWGAALAWRRDREWFALLACQIGVHFAALALVRAPDLHSAIVLVRYTVALVPALVITEAIGWADLVQRLTGRPVRGDRLPAAAAACCLVVCGIGIACGPLPVTFAVGGNFMHHAAYQETYRFDRARAFSNVHRPPLDATLDALPDFYRQLTQAHRRDAGGLIEYPFPLGHNFCQTYFSQSHHRRPVWGGYLGDRRLVDPPLAHIQGPASPGTLARATPDPGRLRFKRFVELRDAEAIQATGARYLVVHLRPVAEAAGKTESFGGTNYAETDPAFLARLAEALEKQLGHAVYADDWIRVFDLRNLVEPLDLPTDNATSLRNEALGSPDPDRRLAALERAAILSPRDPRVRLDAAIVLLDREDYGRALPLFESALELGAGEPAELLATAHDGCGLALARLGRPAEAARNFAAALALRPDDPILVQRLETARREARDRASAAP